MFIQTMFLFFAGKEKKLYQTCLDSGVISQHMGYIILVGIQRTHAATRTACCAGVIVIQLLFFFLFFFCYQKTRRCLPLLYESRCFQPTLVVKARV